MKGFRFILLGLVMMVFSSCMKWPAVYIGYSSGILEYDRVSGRLSLLWEKQIQVKDTARVDSLSVQ